MTSKSSLILPFAEADRAIRPSTPSSKDQTRGILLPGLIVPIRYSTSMKGPRTSQSKLYHLKARELDPSHWYVLYGIETGWSSLSRFKE